MKRWSLVFLCWTQLAHAQPPACPGFPDTSGAGLLARLRALPPVGIDEERDSCPPATVTSLVHGAGDLCLFNGEVLAAMAAVTALASDASVVEYNYLLPYAPAAHARLLAILDSRYARVPPQQVPAYLRVPVRGQETTAFFDGGAWLIALGKPTQGDPTSWYSNIIFESRAHPALGLRKRCQP